MTRARTLPVLTIAWLLASAPAAAQLGGPEALSRGLEALLGTPLPPEIAEGDEPTGPERPAGYGEFRLTATNRLEFHARDLPVADAFAQLRTLVRRNIVVAPDVLYTFTGDLYDLSIDETIDAIARSTGLVVRRDGAFIFVELDQPATRIFELRYARAEDVVTLVEPLLTEGVGRVSATIASRVGIISSQEEAGGNEYASDDVLLVHDYPAVLAEVVEVVRSLDVRPRQVLVDATILSAQLSDDMQFGIDFTALAGVDFEKVGATSPDGSTIDIGGFDSEAFGAGFSSLDSNFTDLLSQGGLNLGFISGDVAAFVRALEQLTETTIHANPQIVTLNKQRGEVLLGRRDGYLTSIVTQTSTTQRVEFLETGTRLIFRPFIGDDGYVRLEIHPEDSDGGVTADGLPFKETAEVTTNVLVRSGQTLVIGGLFRERAERIEKKVPVLGDIPWVGRAFSSVEDVAVREEIIVVLTPRILDGASETWGGASGTWDAASGTWSDGAGGLRGAKRRLDTTMAGVYVNTARTLVEDGDYGSALLFLQASRGLHPERVQDETLKEQIFRRTVPEAQAQARRIDELIMQEMLRAPAGDGR